jgi:hypothetical protein
MQDFLLDENRSLSEMDGDSVGSRLQVKSSLYNYELVYQNLELCML